MTVRYDPKGTTRDKLAEVIRSLGYKVEVIKAESPTAAVAKRARAAIPKDAPKFFRAAFEEARKAGLPVVVDFGATWCSPCVRLKKETLENRDVVKALERVVLVYVDVDEFPELSKAYAVTSIPDVVFIDRDGLIIDRLRNFEPPRAFLARLKKLSKKEEKEEEEEEEEEEQQQQQQQQQQQEK